MPVAGSGLGPRLSAAVAREVVDPGRQPLPLHELAMPAKNRLRLHEQPIPSFLRHQPTQGGTNALVADLVKSRSLGAAMGVFGTIWDSGEALGPILAGALLGVTTYSLSFIFIAAVMLAAVLVFQIGVRDPTATKFKA